MKEDEMKLKRRNFLKSAALLAVPGIPAVGFGGTCTDDATLLHLELQKQLFFDNLLIESVQDITREFHQPRKYEGNPLIVKDKPWEHVVQFRTSGYTVLRDPKDKLFKAWYTDEGFTNENVRRGVTWPPYRSFYAYSEDGIHWVKPPLGIYPENGQDTNIYSTGFDERTVLLDPSEPDGPKRFKSIGFWAPEVESQGGHIQATYSADGLHWKNYDELPSFGKFGPYLGDSTILSYDPDSKLYILTTRHPKMGIIAQNPRFPTTKSYIGPYYPEDFSRMEKRRIFQSESKDFVHWSEPRLMLYPDEEDNLDDYLYGMSQFRIGSGDTRVGFLNLLHSVPDVMNVQLAYSLDGTCWKRVHKPWLTVGPAGSWDQIMVELTNDPLEMGDEWWLYYGGSGFGHHDWYINGLLEGLDVPEAKDVSKVGFFLGLAKLRLDGFCSLNAGPVREGILITRQLASPGAGVVMNAECGPGGYIDVEIFNQADEVMPGYSRKEFDRFTGDAVKHRLSWQSRTKVPPEAFRRLVFYMRSAKLYSLNFSA
jgi:hypothetical protein